MPEPSPVAAITHRLEGIGHGAEAFVEPTTPTSHGWMTAPIIAFPPPAEPCHQGCSSLTSYDPLTTLRSHRSGYVQCNKATRTTLLPRTPYRRSSQNFPTRHLVNKPSADAPVDTGWHHGGETGEVAIKVGGSQNDHTYSQRAGSTGTNRRDC